MTLTRKDVLDTKALADAATPGLWTTEKPGTDTDGWSQGVLVAAVARGQCVYAHPPGGSFPEADRHFIAAARVLVPGLAEALLEAVYILGAAADTDCHCNESIAALGNPPCPPCRARAFLAAFEAEAERA